MPPSVPRPRGRRRPPAHHNRGQLFSKENSVDNFISGTAARRFRRKTAAASIRAPGQTVRTLQFGLDLSRVSGEIDFDAARRL
ncbi:MAG: hypothetical protein ACK55I_39240, partial [bacterium]